MKLYRGSKILFPAVSGATALILIGSYGLIHHFNRYDEEGYDKSGYDRNGFDRRGFNREGYNCHGFNAKGFNRKGYDAAGYDKDGYDSTGIDRDGYNRAGFAYDGFNREGVDSQGFGRDRYNCCGFDRANCCRQFYVKYIEKLRERLYQANHQMKDGEYRYALYDTRMVMEEALKLIVQHEGGKELLGSKIIENLKICEKKHLLDMELIDKLHSVRKICNSNGHEFGIDERISHDKVYFSVMTVMDLLNASESALVNAQE